MPDMAAEDRAGSKNRQIDLLYETRSFCNGDKLDRSSKKAKLWVAGLGG